MHTFATEVANVDVSVYTLMKLLGHESMLTSTLRRWRRHQTRAASELNPLYDRLEKNGT